jgi:hypothetical protein
MDLLSNIKKYFTACIINYIRYTMFSGLLSKIEGLYLSGDEGDSICKTDSKSFAENINKLYDIVNRGETRYERDVITTYEYLVDMLSKNKENIDSIYTILENIVNRKRLDKLENVFKICYGYRSLMDSWDDNHNALYIEDIDCYVLYRDIGLISDLMNDLHDIKSEKYHVVKAGNQHHFYTILEGDIDINEIANVRDIILKIFDKKHICITINSKKSITFIIKDFMGSYYDHRENFEYMIGKIKNNKLISKLKQPKVIGDRGKWIKYIPFSGSVLVDKHINYVGEAKVLEFINDDIRKIIHNQQKETLPIETEAINFIQNNSPEDEIYTKYYQSYKLGKVEFLNKNAFSNIMRNMGWKTEHRRNGSHWVRI